MLVINATWKKKDYLKKMQELAGSIIDEFQNGGIQFASIIRYKDWIVKNELMGKQDALSAVEATTCRLQTDNNTFLQCLKDTNEMLTNKCGHHQNKVNVLVVAF